MRANRGLVDFQKYISFCCVAVTMVLTLGVIIEEAPVATDIHAYNKGDRAVCKKIMKYNTSLESELIKGWGHDCEKFKEADPWYYILLFPTDIVLVLCFLVILLLLADWILFIASVILFFINDTIRFDVSVTEDLRRELAASYPGAS